jgi:hypothetical protein
VTISNLNTLDPYPLTTALTDNYHKAFITEMDPDDPGPSEGYFMDNSLEPLPIATPLLSHYTSQTTPNRHSPDTSLDALDGHGSLSEIHSQIHDSITQADLNPYDSFTLDPMTHSSLDY